MTVAAMAGVAGPAPARAADKPNILVIMADDVGYWNISAYNRGMMGYRTPNIDRIAKEGAIFTDYYGQQSCTAGRAAFITGQTPLRTGLTKVGLPGAKEGLSDKDPTLAELLKPQGYRLEVGEMSDQKTARGKDWTVSAQTVQNTRRESASAVDVSELDKTMAQATRPIRRARAAVSRLATDVNSRALLVPVRMRMSSPFRREHAAIGTC